MTNTESEREFRDNLPFIDEFEDAYRYAKRRPCWICHEPTAWGMCERCSVSPDPDVQLSDEYGTIAAPGSDTDGAL